MQPQLTAHTLRRMKTYSIDRRERDFLVIEAGQRSNLAAEAQAWAAHRQMTATAPGIRSGGLGQRWP